ncbi:MAG: hypothetical protein KJ721_00380 [Nanoarchaeota archaeon]|nr:hypothetical protein [Nanoarchaeota archaeon]
MESDDRDYIPSAKPDDSIGEPNDYLIDGPKDKHIKVVHVDFCASGPKVPEKCPFRKGERNGKRYCVNGLECTDNFSNCLLYKEPLAR